METVFKFKLTESEFLWIKASAITFIKKSIHRPDLNHSSLLYYYIGINSNTIRVMTTDDEMVEVIEKWTKINNALILCGK